MVNRRLLHVVLTACLLTGSTALVSAAAPAPELAPGELFDWAAIRRENLESDEAPIVITPATLSIMRFATAVAPQRSRTPVSVRISRIQNHVRCKVKKLPRTP